MKKLLLLDFFRQIENEIYCIVKISDKFPEYYDGSDMEQAYKRRYSLFDRIRYYWSEERVQASFEKLLHNMKNTGIPKTLLSQFFPSQYRKIRAGELSRDPDDLLRDRVREVIADYAYAAGMRAQ